MCGGEHTQEAGTELFPPLPPEVEKIANELAVGELDPDFYSKLLESQCGVADDSQDVESYDGALGVTEAFVNARQVPVGQLQWNNNLAAIYTNPGNVSGARWCTGVLIGNNLFLTAGHCLDSNPPEWQVPRVNGTNDSIRPNEIATNMHVNLNYQRDPAGNLRPVQQFAVTGLTEHRLGGFDYAVLELAGNPQSTFGTGLMSRQDANLNDMVCIIGHPRGSPKRVEAGSVTGLSGSQIRYNDIDTLGGNSGSPIWASPAGQIVGVHTNGGCTTTGGFNFGVRISSLLATSPTLRALLNLQSLQVAGITNDGGMWHTLRRQGGSWVGFGDVKGQAGTHPGSFVAVGCAGVNEELHVCGVTRDG
ncbi:MAG: trypsin-like serine peptidase, partial [Candidatus Binatia bacterium]